MEFFSQNSFFSQQFFLSIFVDFKNFPPNPFLVQEYQCILLKISLMYKLPEPNYCLLNLQVEFFQCLSVSHFHVFDLCIIPLKISINSTETFLLHLKTDPSIT